ncbi:MAG: hypothetical protein ABR583_13170 [Gaiellaceae bacterium]
MSSTMPPDPPTQPTSTTSPPRASGGGFTLGSGDLARLPIPGNAEFLLYALLELVFTFLWWFREDVTTYVWMTITTALTFGYFISRGIAKASRVLEH